MLALNFRILTQWYHTLSLIVGAQPSFSLISVLSELRPRTPSGPGMWWMGSFLSSKPSTISAISFMLTISSLPMFTGSRKSDFVNLKENKLCYSHFILNGRAIYYVVPQYTFNTFIDESERPSLQSISPHFKLISRSDSLSTKCSRGLFPPACIINHSRVIKGSSW